MGGSTQAPLLDKSSHQLKPVSSSIPLSVSSELETGDMRKERGAYYHVSISVTLCRDEEHATGSLLHPKMSKWVPFRVQDLPLTVGPAGPSRSNLWLYLSQSWAHALWPSFQHSALATPGPLNRPFSYLVRSPALFI